MPSGRRAVVAAMVGLMAGVLATAAGAQAPEVRFARQFSMGYLQFNIMEHHQLLEKHAKAAGVGEVKVVWATFNSPAAMNDALLSGSSTSCPAAYPACSPSGRVRRQAPTR